MNRPVCIVKSMSTAKLEGSARERLLAAANELFYEEGIHTVGIDRVIERAGVAKASLYSTFGSKEELVREYLIARQAARRQRITTRIAQYDDPRDRILSVFDLLDETVAQPTFRGCAFINASAEGPRNSEARSLSRESRDWMRALFRDLAKDYGAKRPELIGDRLMLLYDGALVTAAMDGELGGAASAREMAEDLLDAAPLATRRKR